MKIKSAFTLAEIMIFLVVVATLLTILFVTLKPTKVLSDKSVKYRYAAAYDALNLAAYDLMEKEDTDPFFIPTGSAPSLGFQKLCNGLAEYINAESTNCSSPIPNSVGFMQDEEFDFRTLNTQNFPNLAALNGMHFYISQLITDDTTPATNRKYYRSDDPDFVLSFYMVYVDLNGKDFNQRPHRIIPHNKKSHPDVFAFAVIPTGDAIPIGIAEYDIKYLQTRVAYKVNSSIYYSPYYSFREAKHAAWNLYSSETDNLQLIKTVSFTYNDYVKEILKSHSTQLYKFNSGNIYPGTYSTNMSTKCLPPAGTALSVYDMCRITVDTPNFGATH